MGDLLQKLAGFSLVLLLPFVIVGGALFTLFAVGALFEAACRLGALLGDPGPAAADGLGAFGGRIGLAFQLFDGQFYSYTDATNDLKAIWQQIHSDVSAASYPTQWNNNTQRGRELDAMSITDWINAYVPGGMSSKLGQLLGVAYNIYLL